MERVSEATERQGWFGSFEELVAHTRSMTPEEREQRRRSSDAAFAAELHRKRLEHLRNLFHGLSEIDEKYRDCTLENYEPRNDGQQLALEAMWKIVDDPMHIGLGLTGMPGLGKSILSASLVNTCNDRLIPAVFVTWVNFIDLLRETYDNDGRLRRGKREIIDHYTAAHVLVIDDIDKEPLTVDVARHLFRVLDRRDKRKRPLVVTANHSLSDIGNSWRFGVGVPIEKRPDQETTYAIYRRLKELCGSWRHIQPKKAGVA